MELTTSIAVRQLRNRENRRRKITREFFLHHKQAPNYLTHIRSGRVPEFGPRSLRRVIAPPVHFIIGTSDRRLPADSHWRPSMRRCLVKRRHLLSFLISLFLFHACHRRSFLICFLVSAVAAWSLTVRLFQTFPPRAKMIPSSLLMCRTCSEVRCSVSQPALKISLSEFV